MGGVGGKAGWSWIVSPQSGLPLILVHLGRYPHSPRSCRFILDGSRLARSSSILDSLGEGDGLVSIEEGTRSSIGRQIQLENRQEIFERLEDLLSDVDVHWSGRTSLQVSDHYRM